MHNFFISIFQGRYVTGNRNSTPWSKGIKFRFEKTKHLHTKTSIARLSNGRDTVSASIKRIVDSRLLTILSVHET
jgi:hypothetical protein